MLLKMTNQKELYFPTLKFTAYRDVAYDIPQEDAEKLLKTGYFEEVKENKKKESEVKKDA